MLNSPKRRNEHPVRWPLYATIAFLMACTVLGGASRADVVQHALLRPLAILLAVAIICFAPRIDWRAIRWPGGLLLALTLLMVLQLVPLPYSWWTALPDREIARSVMELINGTGRAHGLSLTPDLTLNSLLSLTIPAATLLAMASLGSRDRRVVLPWLVLIILANMLLGFMQLVEGRFYLYSVTNLGSAVGFFANRNHNAALIAAALPLLACAATWPLSTPRWRPLLLLVTAALGVLSILAIVTVGSRWGIVLAGVGLLWALTMVWRDLRGLTRRQSAMARLAILSVPLAAIVTIVIIAIVGSRDESIRRLSDVAVLADLRMQTLPVTWSMLQSFFPLGTGFGSFDAMYRAVEPAELLSLQYLNHAHNDYLEFGIEAGVAGLILLIAALAWYAVRTISSVRRHPTGETIDRRIAQAASGVLMIAALASVTDYPLRTPMWMMVVAVCAVWLAGRGDAARAKTDGSSSGERASSPRTRSLRS